MVAAVLDQLGRRPGVLRLSLTARCNLACPYCCPDDHDPPELLSPGERRTLIAVATGLGFSSLRLTGGEPLLHQGLEALIEAVQDLRQPAGLREVALTTNGVLLTAARARALRQAGLDRITISLDGADGASVALMSGRAHQGELLLARVLEGVRHAREAGFDPGRGQLKLNAVIDRRRNADQLLPLARLARELGVELRLIEFMDVGNRNGWSPDQVLTAAEMVERIGSRWPLQPQGRAHHGTASRWRYLDRDDDLHLAVVASISAPFCGDCNRLRVTADGQAYTCLFGTAGTDLKPWLRPRPDAAGLRARLQALWGQRHDRYSEERAHLEPGATLPHAEMAYLGG
ncbi:GTP 3',8-cyclase MoaA [Cyanobium sp. LEGE 06113]|uniref:GTP 3',8-cyclase MoaA n=1 Tax=Cyanobium sp. LEGE 06113 TaxID=1297573 RepID=UPI00351C1980